MKHNLKKRLLFTTFLVSTFFSWAQTTLKGSVSNPETQEKIPLVNIVEKGTNNGTTTDFDGNFQISVASLPTTLQLSSIGYETKEIEVTSDTFQELTLAESSESLDEVVVTGLASSVKRENLANAVSTVSSDELVGNTGQTTVDGALYGKVTGVNITQSSGAPGGGFALRLRGVSSIEGNNQPLIIVDGVYINNVEIPSGLRFASGANAGNEENSGNRLADLDPNDIENIEILKGSSAAAIYGQRGNAGVIIITTKRGKGGKTRISFSQDTGLNVIQRKLGLRPWTAESVEETFNAAARQQFEETIRTNGELFDYEDILYGNVGLITDTRLSATGGEGRTKFYVGGSYRDEEGIIANTGFQRLSLRANIDHKISDVFNFSTSTNYVNSESSRSFTGNENEGGLSYGYTLAFTRPWINLFPDEDGNYPNNPNYPGNPLFVRDRTKNEDTNNRIIQGAKLTTKFLSTANDRLEMVLSGGVDYLANETYVLVPEDHQAQIGNLRGFISQGKNNFAQLNFQGIGVWNHNTLNDNLNLTTQAGITYLKQDANLINARGTQILANQTNVDQSVNQINTQTVTAEEDFGYFGQIEGNYKDQIIATLGYRLDSSTRNGDPSEFFGFPKASLAINIANFDFWKVKSVNQVKVRAAYGETGSPADFGSLYTRLVLANIDGNNGVQTQGTLGDSDIIPETAAEIEVGLDLSFFDSRITFEGTYYDKNIRDLILSPFVPTSSGFNRQTINAGDLRNYGAEFAMRADVVRTENVYWNTGIQYYFNDSEVTRLDTPPFVPPGAGFGLRLGTFYIQEGRPITQIVTNLNGVPTPVGDTQPDFQMAFSNQLTLFKQWDLSFLLQWKKGGDNLNLSRYLNDLGRTSNDLETPEGQARLALPANAVRFLESASYARMREAALYYRLSSKDIQSIFGDTITDIKLGLSARNLFTITDYSSYDPEVSVNGGSGLSNGLEVTPFPSSKQFYFHLNVNF